MTCLKTKTAPPASYRLWFRAGMTAAEVIRSIDLSGRTAIVTGGYSGIGLETTRTILSAGAKAVVTSAMGKAVPQ